MAEPAVAFPGLPPLDAAQRLGREIAFVGARLADLLGRLPGAGDAAVTDGCAFLASMHSAWADGLPRGACEGNALERAPAGAPQPLDRLAARLALAPAEVDLLLLAAMPDEHEGYASALRTLHPRGEGRATVGLAAQLLCPDWRDRSALRALLLQGPAVRSGLLGLSGDACLFEQNLLLAPDAWPALGGLDVWPREATPLPLDAVASGLDDWLAEAATGRAARALTRPEPRVVLVVADSERVAAHRAAALCEHAGVGWAAFDLATPGRAADAAAAGADRLALLHCLLRGRVPIFLLDGGADGAPSAGAAPPGAHGFDSAVVVCVRRGAALRFDDRPLLGLTINPLPSQARQRLWRGALPELGDDAAATLAMRYPMEPAAAARVAADVRSTAALAAAGEGDVESDGVDRLGPVAQSVRVRTGSQLAPGLDVVCPSARWDQLVLPALRKAQLAEALARLAHQSTVLDRWRFLDGRPGARGVRMLLCGPPGTGKSLSGEVMAQALGVDLLVVDISRLVSKWIGETEKNLAAVFDAAERTQAVLLFDEADALFGKRTEVSDAHDRYANLETAYLLSRLERFEGLALLSTNLKHNIDPAFLRRLEFVVEFDEPQLAEREALWRCHLPSAAPLAGDVNLAELARLYPIAGGLIRNACVAAGFTAAADGALITRRHLVGAVAREYEKAGKAFPGVPPGLADAAPADARRH